MSGIFYTIGILGAFNAVADSHEHLLVNTVAACLFALTGLVLSQKRSR